MTQASFIATCLLNANRLPKPYCALRSQHLLSQMHSLSITPELYSGTFPQKSTFIKISLPLYLPNPPRVKDQGRTKDEPRNTQRTPNHQKVLFIKIGYLKEIFVTVASAICLPCQILCQFPLHPFVKFLYTLAQVPKCHIADNQQLSYFGTPFE